MAELGTVGGGSALGGGASLKSNLAAGTRPREKPALRPRASRRPSPGRGLGPQCPPGRSASPAQGEQWDPRPGTSHLDSRQVWWQNFRYKAFASSPAGERGGGRGAR